MKKVLFFAAIAALTVMASCQKEGRPDQGKADPIVFSADIAESSNTKVSVDLTNGKVSWVAGDEITISDGTNTGVYTANSTGSSTTFTYSSGTQFTAAGNYSATYGTVPTVGVDQIYDETPGKMIHMSAPAVSATSATGANFTFTADCGLLKLNLTASGKSVKRIYVSNGTNTYQLLCETAQDIATAKDFYIALPVGTYTKYVIQDEEGYEAVKTAKAGKGTAIANNQINKVAFSNMTFNAPIYPESGTSAVKMAGIWWAPENCGYSTSVTNGTKGKIYQWGRSVGSYWGSNTQAKTAEGKDTRTDNPADGTFYLIGTFTDPWDWRENQLSSWPMKSGDTGYIAGKVDNPCPIGWRVPTIDEIGALCYTDYNPSEKTWNTRRSGNVLTNGWQFTQEGGSSLSFVHSGSRAGVNGNWSQENIAGTYFTSTTSGKYVYALVVATSNANRAWIDRESVRANGFSVRCVLDK